MNFLPPTPSQVCQSCGACCAHFRASFHWLETRAAPGGTVPEHLTEPVTPHLVAMRGTNGRTPRCIALEGTIGERVACGIYADRASPCRDFKVAWEDGVPNPRCDQARAARGMAPVAPGTFDDIVPPRAA
ncbi:MAG: YkgJ family cysteine cluster protein [Chromatiales bacterium]|nr:YkgJ family cysteine cluster protein [Chromatiales bacterium]